MGLYVGSTVINTPDMDGAIALWKEAPCVVQSPHTQD